MCKELEVLTRLWVKFHLCTDMVSFLRRSERVLNFVQMINKMKVRGQKDKHIALLISTHAHHPSSSNIIGSHLCSQSPFFYSFSNSSPLILLSITPACNFVIL